MVAIEGVKGDNGKLRWRLIPWQLMVDVVKVMDKGATKYGEHNWTGVENAGPRYFDALMRHLMAWANGERDDPDDGLHHLAHVICCALIIMWHERKGHG